MWLTKDMASKKKICTSYLSCLASLMTKQISTKKASEWDLLFAKRLLKASMVILNVSLKAHRKGALLPLAWEWTYRKGFRMGWLLFGKWPRVSKQLRRRIVSKLCPRKPSKTKVKTIKINRNVSLISALIKTHCWRDKNTGAMWEIANRRFWSIRKLRRQPESQILVVKMTLMTLTSNRLFWTAWTSL